MKRIALFQFHDHYETCSNRMQMLHALNPGVEIYGLFGGDSDRIEDVPRTFTNMFEHVYVLQDGDSAWKWRNTDLCVRRWYHDFGHGVDFDVLHVLQWDLLFFEPLSSAYRHVPAESVALTGVTHLDAIASRWHWALNEPHKTQLGQLRQFVREEFGDDQPLNVCLGPGYCLPRQFLSRYVAADVPELGHDEIRLPLFARLLGFQVTDTGFYRRWFDEMEEKLFNANGDEIDEATIRLELSRPGGRRVFHPYRKTFRIPARAR